MKTAEGDDQRQYVVAGQIQYFEENCGETFIDSIHGITLECSEEYSAGGIDEGEQRSRR